MNRASKSIWTHVLSGVEDLPPCPEDLSEPQYAYLMFTDHCHVSRLGTMTLSDTNEFDAIQECLRSLSSLGKDETLLLYLEARTQLCRACSLKQCVSRAVRPINASIDMHLVVVVCKRSFKCWQELPEHPYLPLAELVPATVNRLTEEELDAFVCKRPGRLGSPLEVRLSFRLTIAPIRHQAPCKNRSGTLRRFQET